MSKTIKTYKGYLKLNSMNKSFKKTGIALASLAAIGTPTLFLICKQEEKINGILRTLKCAVSMM